MSKVLIREPGSGLLGNICFQGMPIVFLRPEKKQFVAKLEHNSLV
jgi:hypothetical protein